MVDCKKTLRLTPAQCKDNELTVSECTFIYDHFDTLKDVPNQNFIRFSSLTKIISGSTENSYTYLKSKDTLVNFDFLENPHLEIVQKCSFYSRSKLEAINFSSSIYLL